MAASEAERAKAMVAIQDVFDKYLLILADSPLELFDTKVMRDIKLVDGSPLGGSSFELVITTAYGNLNGVMHGGAAGVIFDMCTTMALTPLAKPGFWDFLGGVTRTLNISYLRAVPIGTTVRINSKVVQIGRTMALIRGEMVSLDGKTIYCTADHHKVHVPTRVEHLKPAYERGMIKEQAKVTLGVREGKL